MHMQVTEKGLLQGSTRCAGSPLFRISILLAINAVCPYDQAKKK
jgi:hypothetical protein